MDVSELAVKFIWGIMVIFSRVGSLFATLPGISENFVSARLRLSLAFAVSLGLLPNLSSIIPLLPQGLANIFLLLSQEILIGVFFGCLVRILLSATSLAGNILSMQSSLSSATMFDPTQGGQNAIIASFYNISAITLVFVTDIHHIMLEGIVDSFYIFQIDYKFFSPDMADLIIAATARSFLIGIKIASPYLVIGLLLNLTSGVIARLMPNMQVFFILTPIQILICLIIFNITFISSLNWYLEELTDITKNFLDLK